MHCARNVKLHSNAIRPLDGVAKRTIPAVVPCSRHPTNQRHPVTCESLPVAKRRSGHAWAELGATAASRGRSDASEAARSMYSSRLPAIVSVRPTFAR